MFRMWHNLPFLVATSPMTIWAGLVLLSRRSEPVREFQSPAAKLHEMSIWEALCRTR
jgi:hypothetical protein